MPWIVPRTVGWGEQLLIRMADAGVAKVRPTVWMKRRPVSAIHTGRPVFWLGGGVVDGMSARKGMRAKTMGKA